MHPTPLPAWSRQNWDIAMLSAAGIADGSDEVAVTHLRPAPGCRRTAKVPEAAQGTSAAAPANAFG
jgi:hypothetical protein